VTRVKVSSFGEILQILKTYEDQFGSVLIDVCRNKNSTFIIYDSNQKPLVKLELNNFHVRKSVQRSNYPHL
jgi:hypothetical protein